MAALVNSRRVNDMNLNDSPDDDSPKHILNALDDFCIQTIFRKLTNVEDFVNVSMVCTIFLDNAKACFQLTHKTIDIIDSSEDDLCRNNAQTNKINPLSPKQLQFLWQHFGHLIHGIRYGACNAMENAEHNLFNSVIEFCGPTLCQLKVYRHLCDTTKNEIASSHAHISFDDPSRFPLLSELQLDDISVENFHLPSTLEKLTLYGVKSTHFEDCVQAYPKLTKFSIEFDRGAELPNQLDANFLKLLELNPQIVHLSVPALSVNLKDIHHYTPDLETFCCMRFDGESDQKFLKLKHFTVGEITDEQMTFLATNMPSMETVKIYICQELLAKGITKALNVAKNLNELYLFDMNLDPDDYHSILRAIQGRSIPCYVRVRCIDDVPADVFSANAKSLFSVWCRYTN